MDSYLLNNYKLIFVYLFDNNQQKKCEVSVQVSECLEAEELKNTLSCLAGER